MSETVEEVTETEAQPTADKTFTQEEVNSLLAAEKRKIRSQFEDYDDIKSRAEKADELSKALVAKDSELTELATKAEQAQLTALRTSIAAEHNVPLPALTAASEEELRDQAAQLIAWRDGSKPVVRKESNSSGNAPGGSSSDPREAAAQALRGPWR